MVTAPASQPATQPDDDDDMFMPSARFDLGAAVPLGSKARAGFTADVLGGTFIGFKQQHLHLIVEGGYSFASPAQHLGVAGLEIVGGAESVHAGGGLHFLLGSDNARLAFGGRATIYVGFLYESLFIESGWQPLWSGGGVTQSLRFTAGVNVTALLAYVIVTSMVNAAFKGD
jgi:hypothetical protein